MSADMKTSHGEPAVICVYSVLDEAELTIMLQLFALSNAWVMLATTLVRLEAANTVRVAGGGTAVGTGVGEADGDGEALGVVVGDDVAVAVWWRWSEIRLLVVVSVLKRVWGCWRMFRYMLNSLLLKPTIIMTTNVMATYLVFI